MNRDDMIRMAREADINLSTVEYYQRELTHFGALVAAAEREKVAAWMIQRSYATGHGDTTEDLLKELEWQVTEREREACATVCDEFAERDRLSNYYAVAARAIRARGQA